VLYGEAASVAEDVIALFSQDLDHLQKFAVNFNNLAVQKFARGRKREAIYLMKQAVAFRENAARLAPTQPPMSLVRNYVNLARMLANSPAAMDGDTARAVAVIEKALAVQPTDQESLSLIAWALLTTENKSVRDPVKALELAKKAMDKEPQPSNVVNTLGVALYRTGNWNEAIKVLERSIERNKVDNKCQNAWNWYFLAMAHWQLGEREKAQVYYKQAVDWMEKKRPRDVELRRFRAEAAEVMGIKLETMDPQPPPDK